MVTIVATLVGLAAAFGSIVPTRKFLRPRHEGMFYSVSLIPIAMIYVGFSFYYGNPDSLNAELIGVAIFSVFALLGYFKSLSLLSVGYLLHAAWDVLHEVYIEAAPGGLSWTQVPMGYATFCLVYDVIIAIYILQRFEAWEQDAPGLTDKN
jgi:hypothetical protein